jgi:hypothetical protein
MSHWNFFLDNNEKEATMGPKTVALATAFGLATSFAFAQSPSSDFGEDAEKGPRFRHAARSLWIVGQSL